MNYLNPRGRGLAASLLLASNLLVGMSAAAGTPEPPGLFTSLPGKPRALPPEQAIEGRSAWVGHASGRPGDRVVIGTSGDAVAATFAIGDRLFKLAPRAGGLLDYKVASWISQLKRADVGRVGIEYVNGCSFSGKLDVRSEDTCRSGLIS